MAQAQEPFPYFELPANQWLSSQTPTLPLKKPADTRITLRVTGGQKSVTLRVSNVGIQSDGGLKPLETFLDLRNWKGPVAPELVQEDGRHGLRWKFPPGVTFVDFKDPGSAFKQAKQVRLAFQWKLSNADETVRPLVLRFPGPCAPSPYFFREATGTNPPSPTVLIASSFPFRRAGCFP